jgi:hypothetical protein
MQRKGYAPTHQGKQVPMAPLPGHAEACVEQTVKPIKSGDVDTP